VSKAEWKENEKSSDEIINEFEKIRKSKIEIA